MSSTLALSTTETSIQEDEGNTLYNRRGLDLLAKRRPRPQIGLSAKNALER